MLFQQRVLHRIIAFGLIIILMLGCSGNRWVTVYDQNVELKEECKVFINQRYQGYYYELHDAQAFNNQLSGYVIVDDEINTVPREIDNFVVYCEMNIDASDIDSIGVTIPFESIIKVRMFEYNKGVRYSRTIFLIIVPIVLGLMIYDGLNSMDLRGVYLR